MTKEKLDSLTVEDIVANINQNNKLLPQLVGSLYPEILMEENRFMKQYLIDHRNYSYNSGKYYQLKKSEGEKMKTIEQNKFKELVSRFTNHIPDKDTLVAMKDIRSKVRELAYLIEKSCPDSREKQTALTQLSFVMMSANSAIVQKCPINKDELTAEEAGLL